MKRLGFFSGILFMLLSCGLHQEACGTDVFVMFQPNLASIDGAVFTKGLITTNEIKSQAIVTILNKYGCTSIKATVPNGWADTIAYMPDGSIIKMLDLSCIYRLKFDNDKIDIKAVLKELHDTPDVVFAEEQGIIKLHTTPNDISFNLQWGLSQGTNCDIDAPEAWDIFTGSSSIKIGIMDTGVKLDHEDLSGKVSGDAPIGEWHGTHVAGIAAAITNNGKGVAGVDWNATVYSKRLNLSDYVAIYNSIIDAVNQGCHVLNNSWGGEGYSTILRSAFAYAYKMNRAAIVSMGNDYTGTPMYPAAFGQGIIAVGATDRYDVKPAYSNTGNHIDVVAPGGVNPYPNTNEDDILSTWGDALKQYEYLAGTSMSAPFVTGLASLLKGYNANLSNDDIEQIIRISADDVNSATYPGWDQYLGTGRINAKKALDLLGYNYCFKQWSASGGTSVGNTDLYVKTFYSVPGIAAGNYIVKRYDVRKSVTFPAIFNSIPYMWGRGYGSIGYSLENPNYAMPWCQVVSGTQTATGCQLQTYVYELWTIAGSYVGYKPCAPSSVTFQYSVLGPYDPPVSAFISGYYVPPEETKGISGYTYLSWSCVRGTLPVTYTLQVQEPYITGNWITLISNTTATSYNYQDTPWEEGSAYRVIVNDGKSTIYSNTAVIYPPNPSDPIVSETNSTEATIFSNGKKIAVDNAKNVHVVYSSGDSVYYSLSTDNGASWPSAKIFIGIGKYPALELTGKQVPTICWINGNCLYGSKKEKNGFAKPYLIYTGAVGTSLASLSYVLNQNTNKAYLGWIEESTTGSVVKISGYNPDTYALSSTATIDNGEMGAFKTPSLAYDRFGNISIAWSRSGKIYYKDTAGQTEIGQNGLNPDLDIYGDKTTVVWQEETLPGIYQIVKRTKGTLGWSDKKVISYPDSLNADYPAVAVAGQYVYSKNTKDADYDLIWNAEYENGWLMSTQNLSSAQGGLSRYPSLAFKQGWPKSQLHMLWTEEMPEDDSKAAKPRPPVKTLVIIVDAVPYYYVDAGTEESVIYTTQRTGNYYYGPQPDYTVDYDPLKLMYSFPGLNPLKDYLIKVTYYHESDKPITQTLAVDNTLNIQSSIDPKTMVTTESWISGNCIKDGKIDVTITRATGDYAVCSVIALYEFDADYSKSAEDIADNSGKVLPSYSYELMQSCPNPTTGKTAIKYQLAQPGKVSLKVYNTLGQVVKTLVSQDQAAGYYNVTWDGRGNNGRTTANGVYFYRLESGDFKATKKMVVIR